jgi:hypothetical protein
VENGRGSRSTRIGDTETSVQLIGMQQAQNRAPDDGTTPPQPQKPLACWYAQGPSDGLGDRLLMFDNSTAPSLELLRLRPDFASAPGFEAALRERVRRLRQFKHPAFARVRAVEFLERREGLALISNYTPGQRLSEVLDKARGPARAASLISELAPALLMLQQHGAGLAHGVLGVDRIVVSPEGGLTIVEHVLGSALQTLQLPASQLATIGVAVPPGQGDGVPQLDGTTDLFQLGLVAVSVLVGRRLSAEEHPQVEQLLDHFAHSARRDGYALSPFLRRWLQRALQIGGEKFESTAHVREGLDELRALDHGARTPFELSTAGDVVITDDVVITEIDDQPAATAAPASDPIPEAMDASGRAAAIDIDDIDDLAAFDAEADAPAVAPPVVPTPPTPVSPPAATSRPVRPTAPAPRPASAPRPAPMPRPAPTPAAVEIRARQPESPAPPPTARRTLFDQQPSLPQRPTGRAPQPSADERSDRTRPARPHARKGADDAKLRAGGWSRRARPAVTALAMLAAVEAIVIGGFVYRGWMTPASPIVVDPAASGAIVRLDGRPAGATPLKLTVAQDMRWVRVVSPAPRQIGGKPRASTGGSIQISSPIDLQIFEQGRLLGSVPGARLDLSPGRHDIELVNAALGYRQGQPVDIAAGQLVSIYLAPLDGWVNVDAAPWADVTIDGKPAGRTPLVSMPLAPGEHEFAFRHPQLGEDRFKAVIKSDAITRVTAKLRR